MRNGPELASKTQCWPKDWLPMDIPSLRVIGVNYATSLSMWTPFCPIESMKCVLYISYVYLLFDWMKIFGLLLFPQNLSKTRALCVSIITLDAIFD